eukprot:scaffold8069_cov126-Isochrysis_galbana.AAC.11
MDDVAAALARIRKDKETLIPPNAAKALGYGLLSDAPAALSGRVYLGGYSSGAHVAAALLLPRRASTLALARHGLPTDPTRLCDCVLYLSGVFGGSAPGWPAVLARLVFGPAGGTALPSPLLRAAETPQLPHVHIRCETEAFGLPVIEPVMQAMLSGTAYEEALRRACIPLRVHVVHSNHWNVLTSPGLSEALRAELHALPPCKASIREKSGIAWQLRCLWGGDGGDDRPHATACLACVFDRLCTGWCAGGAAPGAAPCRIAGPPQRRASPYTSTCMSAGMIASRALALARRVPRFGVGRAGAGNARHAAVAAWVVAGWGWPGCG